MNIKETELSEVLIIEPKVFGDERGFFVETYSEARYKKSGIPLFFVQDNHSRSSRGVLRGLHFQLNHPQGKLVRVVRGTVYDVAVDIRCGSPTFGQAVGVELSEHNKRQLYIPPGFAHGFVVTSDYADFEYKCTDYYYPGDQYTVLWNDPDLNIEWPISFPILSTKDSNAKPLKDIDSDFLPKHVVSTSDKRPV
jgi:dTDP-4-dehydrorhamnose 3,5-epimerase